MKQLKLIDYLNMRKIKLLNRLLRFECRRSNKMKHQTFIAAAVQMNCELGNAGINLEKESECIDDTCLVVDRDGIQRTYRKIYLWDQEKQRFQKGDRYEVTQLG